MTDREKAFVGVSNPKERYALRPCSQDIAEEAEMMRLRDENALKDHALKLALEYWKHRQQRYKNRAPVWVQEARKVLGDTP